MASILALSVSSFMMYGARGCPGVPPPPMYIRILDSIISGQLPLQSHLTIKHSKADCNIREKEHAKIEDSIDWKNHRTDAGGEIQCDPCGRRSIRGCDPSNRASGSSRSQVHMKPLPRRVKPQKLRFGTELCTLKGTKQITLVLSGTNKC